MLPLSPDFDVSSLLCDVKFPVVGLFGPPPYAACALELAKAMPPFDLVIACCPDAATAKEYASRPGGAEVVTQVTPTMSAVYDTWDSHSTKLISAWYDEDTRRLSRNEVSDGEEAERVLLIIDGGLMRTASSACMREMLCDRRRFGLSVIYTADESAWAREYLARAQTDLAVVEGLVPRDFERWTQTDLEPLEGKRIALRGGIVHRPAASGSGDSLQSTTRAAPSRDTRYPRSRKMSSR